MRLLGTIFSAVCFVLFCAAIFFWIRSYSAFEGAAWFKEDQAPIAAAWTKPDGSTGTADLASRTAGLLSFRGQLTYATIANPLKSEPAETWSHPVKEAVSRGNAMALLWDPKDSVGITFGTANTRHELLDVNRISWKLSYRYITTPYWFLACLLAIAPYLWFSNYRLLAKREREGRCLKCGTPMNGAETCPKCSATP